MLNLIGETNIDFMRVRRAAAIVSGLLILATIVSLIAHGGPRYSIDFSGGRLVELAFPGADVSAGEVRRALSNVGLGGAEVQHFEAGGETGEHAGVILRFKEEDAALSEGGESGPTALIIEALRAANAGLEVDVRREESVGPKIGSELRGRAVKAIVFALAAILLYVSIRYELIFALGAVLALFHDVFVTLGIFSLLNLEISLPIVAALLTIAGYSINDTIVVFDRIRERRRAEQRKPIVEVINASINQMLSRTVVTSVTTLFAALSLYLVGGPVIHDFAFAIVIGVIIGTYSSVFVATALVFELLSGRERMGRGRRQSKARAASPSP